MDCADRTAALRFPRFGWSRGATTLPPMRVRPVFRRGQQKGTAVQQSTPFPCFEVEGHRFSRVLLGHNPFIGGSYMSQARSRLYKETLGEPEAVARIICAAIEAGIGGMMTGVQSEHDAHIVQALKMATERTGVSLPTFVIVTPGFEEKAELLHEINCRICLIHGQVADALYVKAERTMKPEFAEMTARIRSLGFVPGMSTHNAGEVIPAAEPFDIAVINTPVNKVAWRMCPCEELVLRAIRNTKKKVVAMKTLAMGRIAPEEAMAYACRLPDLDGLVVGIGHEYEAEETFALARGLLRSTEITLGGE